MKIIRTIFILFFAFSLFAGTFAQVSPLDPAYQITTRKALVPIGAVDLLITGGTIITMDGSRRIIENGAIAVNKGEIVSVGTAAELRTTRARQTINARGKVIIPGLINTHTHVPMSLFRGIADDLDLNDWLTQYIFPAEA
jgi:5-methylthioadenosine/S-adenosylhomocysteine deaminase